MGVWGLPCTRGALPMGPLAQIDGGVQDGLWGSPPPPSLGLQLLAVQLGVGESLSAGSGSWGWEGRETPV